MLTALRNKKTAKKVWIVLAIVIVPAFVLWGSGSLIRGKKEAAYVGRIFGRKISFLEFKDAVDAVRNQAIMQFGEDFLEIQKYLNLEMQAWERLILLAEAKKRKIKVSDKEVIEIIKSYPFLRRKGSFDDATYTSALRYTFHTQPRIFEEQIRSNLMISKLYKEITDGVTLTDEEIKEEYRQSNEQISIHYIASLFSDFIKDVAASDEEIKEFFVKNALQFKQPLSFNMEYISLPMEDKETRNKLNKLTLRLNKKEDFIKVAKDFGLTVKETGLFTQTDPIPGIGWSPEILSLLSKVEPGEFLPSINIDKSYYILRLKEKKEPFVPGFETIKDKVKEAVTKDKSQKLAKEKIDDCLKKLKEAHANDPQSVDFDKTSGECGLKSSSTDLFKYGSYIEGIGASDIFWLVSQKLKEGEFSQIIEMPSGFYIVKPKSRQPIDEEKFKAEKDEFAQKLLLQKKGEYFAKFIEELKIKAQTS